MPHKTAIIPLLDGIDETAKEIGAVNTVSQTEDGLIGHNTDGKGAELAIESYTVHHPRDQRVLILGAGGTARAIVHQLSKNGTRLKILNRDLEKAKQVAKEIGNGNTSVDRLMRTTLENSLRETDLLINATPIQTSALLARLGIQPSIMDGVRWIFDLAYDSSASILPKTARISGLEMLLQQAGLSYKIWFNKEPPLDLMRSALINYLGESWR